MALLNGKHALVTGGGSGIGAAIARALAAEGAALSLAGRRKQPLEAMAKQLPNATAIVADVTHEFDCQAMADFAHSAHGPIDIVIANAGMAASSPAAKIDAAHWQQMIGVNLTGAFNTVHATLADVTRQPGGRIVFISSESAVQIPAEMIHYGVSKTALLGVSRGLAELTAGTGVTVNAVLPGPTRSEGVSDFFAEMAKEQGVTQDEMERDFIAQHRPTSLLRRLATVEEVANMVVYASSAQASATNGAALRVDGGVVRSII